MRTPSRSERRKAAIWYDTVMVDSIPAIYGSISIQWLLDGLSPQEFRSRDRRNFRGADAYDAAPSIQRGIPSGRPSAIQAGP
jgi:hypothetical protein